MPWRIARRVYAVRSMHGSQSGWTVAAISIYNLSDYHNRLLLLLFHALLYEHNKDLCSLFLLTVALYIVIGNAAIVVRVNENEI